MINELCPSNKSGAMDESGSHPDWLELYNATSADLSLSGFYLANTLDSLTQARLDPTLTVKAGGVLLLWADKDATAGSLHLPFNLSAKGKTIYLLDSEQQLVDAVQFGQAEADATYSRLPDGTGSFTWCGKGTPNKLNGSTCPE